MTVKRQPLRQAHFRPQTRRGCPTTGPEARAVGIYRVDAALVSLDANDTLDGGAVLPDFSSAISDIFGM